MFEAELAVHAARAALEDAYGAYRFDPTRRADVTAAEENLERARARYREIATLEVHGRGAGEMSLALATLERRRLSGLRRFA
jgi:hypothetical protein